MVQVKRTDTHERDGLKQCHVQILPLVRVNCLVVAVLPDHAHLSLHHEVLNILEDLSDRRLELLDLFLSHSSCLRHLLVFSFHFLFFGLGHYIFTFLAWVNGQSDLLFVDTIFDITEHESVLSCHCSVKSENTLFMSSATMDDLVIWVQHEKVDETVLFWCGGIGVNEVGSSHVDRIFRGIFVERLNELE